MSSEQLKEGLLLHLDTNRNFVEQKVYKEFAKQCLQQHDIETLDRKKIKQVIQFTFDFGSNQDMKPFYNRLDLNINLFIKEQKQKKPKNAKGNVAMDLQNLIELIIYCVNNGFQKQKPKPKEPQLKEKQQKAVEDKKKVQTTKKQPAFKPAKVQEKKQEQIKKQQKKKPQITLLNPQLQAKVDKIKLVSKPVQTITAAAKVSTRLQIEKIPPKQQFKIQKFEMPNINVGPKYLQSISPKPKKQPEQEKVIYQPINQEILNDQNICKAMKQRLYRIYQHYCSQQQNTGHSSTFDRIKSQMEHMTIGKFLLFCKSTDLFSHSKIVNKDFLVMHFKKMAAGRHEITFEDFESVLKQIDTKYLQQPRNEEPHFKATYEARLRLNSNQGYKQFKKSLNMIFFTRDNKNKDNKLFLSNFGKKDLTSHSGKFGQQLQNQLAKNNRYSQTIDIEASKIGGQSESSKRSKSKNRPMNIEQINMKQWPKIDWLQEQVRRQQQASQDHFPKIAKRKDVVGNIKKRLEQVSKMEVHR